MPRTSLWLAPAGAGKTEYAIKVAQQLTRETQGEVRICVPSKLQSRAWQRRLAQSGGAMGVHVLIFDELVAACLDEARETYVELSDPVQFRLIRTIIERLPLVQYAPLKEKPGFIQVMVDLIEELKNALISPEELIDALQGLGDPPRLRELADIYHEYQATMQSRNWADRVGLHWLAVEKLERQATATGRDWPLLIFDGFDDFTRAQLALLRVLSGRVKQLIVLLTRAQEVDYPRYRQTQQDVENALGVKAYYLEDTGGPARRHPVMQHLTRQLFKIPAGSRVANGDEAVTMREVPDRVSEVRTALRWLKQQIVWRQTPTDQVALLARDMSPYLPFVRQIAAEFGLPVRMVNGQPLGQSPAIAALLSLLRLYLPLGAIGEAALTRREVVATWRSPYFDWGEGEWTITAADADALDNLAREQRVIRGQGQWRAAFSARIGMEERAPGREEEEGEIAPIKRGSPLKLKQQFDYFEQMTRPPATTGTMREFVRWLETLIGPDPETTNEEAPAGSLNIVRQARENPATAEADIAALQTLKEILRGLVWAELALGADQEIDFPTFFSELAGAITAAVFVLPGRADRAEILVANATHVRGLSFSAVAIMGLAEGEFPRTIREDPFLRDADRRILCEQFDLPLEIATKSAEQEFFYETVTRARDSLLLTRPVLADNGADWVASPYWEAVEQLVEVSAETLFSETTVPVAETASRGEWWETVAAFPDEAQWEVAPETWNQIERAARIWRIRQENKPAVWEGDLAPLGQELGERYGSWYIWSASSLESYQTCHFLFFMQKVLNLQPRLEPAEGMDTRQLGSLYHDIFEKVTTAGLPEPPTEENVRQQVARLAGPLLDAAPEKEGFRETPWWSKTRQEIVDNVARSVLELADSEYQFLRAEVAFGFRDDPLIIILGDGDQLRLCGFIDRIDRRPDGVLRLVDYKLGGKYSFRPVDFQKGKKLQLPLYALAAQQAVGLGPVGEGFYWHFSQGEPSHFQLSKAEGGVTGAIETAVDHAWEAISRIRQGQFAPQPPEGGCPSYCPATGFCWQYVPQGW